MVTTLDRAETAVGVLVVDGTRRLNESKVGGDTARWRFNASEEAGVDAVDAGGEIDTKESNGCLVVAGAETGAVVGRLDLVATPGVMRAQSLTAMTAGISTICRFFLAGVDVGLPACLVGEKYL